MKRVSQSTIDLKVWTIITGLAVAAAAGCAEPGVTSCSPVPAGGAYSSGPGTNAGRGAGSAPTAAAGGGGSSSAGAGSGELAPGPCPAGYMCIDLSSVGATAVDQDGKPITHSCGMGGAMNCNDAEPMSTCAPLDNPICAHVKVAGMDIVSCGQRCTP